MMKKAILVILAMAISSTAFAGRLYYDSTPFIEEVREQMQFNAEAIPFGQHRVDSDFGSEPHQWLTFDRTHEDEGAFIRFCEKCGLCMWSSHGDNSKHPWMAFDTPEGQLAVDRTYGGLK